MSKSSAVKKILDLEELDPEEVFSPVQFKSINIRFKKIENLTTRTKVVDLVAVKISEYETKSFVIETPENCGAKGHSLMIEFEFVAPPATFESKHGSRGTITATATIVGKSQLDDGFFRFDLNLVQFEEKSWQHFLDAFSARQDAINEFLKNTKG